MSLQIHLLYSPNMNCHNTESFIETLGTTRQSANLHHNIHNLTLVIHFEAQRITSHDNIRLLKGTYAKKENKEKKNCVF